MTLALPLSYTDFCTQVKSCLDFYENRALESSAANIKKIAKIASLKLEIAEESSKKSINAVKIRKLSAEVTALEALSEDIYQKIIADCYQIYKNAFHAKVPFVLGTNKLRESGSLDELQNFGILSNGETSCPAAILKHVQDTQTGGIFCPRSWSLLKNDSFILGGMHAENVFCVQGPLDHKDLWDTLLDRPKVLTRELALLTSFGYEQLVERAQVDDYGYVFEPTTAIADIDLKNLLIQVSKTRCIASVEKILHPV